MSRLLFDVACWNCSRTDIGCDRADTDAYWGGGAMVVVVVDAEVNSTLILCST